LKNSSSKENFQLQEAHSLALGIKSQLPISQRYSKQSISENSGKSMTLQENIEKKSIKITNSIVTTTRKVISASAHESTGFDNKSATPKAFIKQEIHKSSLSSPKREVLFFEGQTVVYPGHGVGVIERIVRKKVGAVEQKFLDLVLKDSKKTRIMIPVTQASVQGVREVVAKNQLDTIFEILRNRSIPLAPTSWNKRQRDYTLKIKSGCAFQLAEVIRDLSLLGEDKQLSFGEKKILENAQSFLSSEIAEICASSQGEALLTLKNIFN
jgi:CarD family transcriptional regulator